MAPSMTPLTFLKSSEVGSVLGSIGSRMTPIRAPLSPSFRRNPLYEGGTCPTAEAVTGSLGSYPATTRSKIAASAAVRVIGPNVSAVGLNGNEPYRLTKGTVGLKPTRLATAAGPRIDPPVSAPIPTVAKFAAMAEP